MNRAERRRLERAAAKGRPIVYAGDNIIATQTGHQYEARSRATLAPKQEGKHRFVAVGSWVLSDNAIKRAFDPDERKFLDAENLMLLSIGCFDCEQQFGTGEDGTITEASWCPGDPSTR